MQARASNSAGAGPWSESSSATPSVNQPPVIHPPRSQILLSVMENTTGVIWTFTGSDPNGDVLTWAVTGLDAAAFAIASKTDTTAELSTATNTVLDYDSGKTDYAFSVRAYDGNGGEASIIVKLSVKDATPVAPAAPKVTAASRSSVDVSWTEPDKGDPQRPSPTDYNVRYCDPAGSANAASPCDSATAADWTAHPHTGTAVTTTISGLTAATSYEVQVQASNAEGTSEWSASGAGSTAAAEPGAPTDLTLTEGYARLDASWTAPANDGGSAITGYDVHYCPTDTGCDVEAEWTDAGHTGTDTAAAINGLGKGVEYKVRVRAVNTAGTAIGWRRRPLRWPVRATGSGAPL